MRILLIAHGFNGLTQRLHAELRADGHEVSFEYDIADSVTEEAVALWRPEVLIAPFMKRRIPESLWSRLPCLVVHPGPPGDRGPAALDWAVLDGAREWGVTVLQANGDYDAGPVWAAEGFAMRAATKSSLYRREVTRSAVHAVRAALAQGGARAVAAPAGRLRGMPPPELRRVDAARMPLADQLRIARAADGHPGAVDRLFGADVRIFDLHPASAAALARAPAGAPGEVVARRGPALLRRTAGGGVWIGRVRRLDRPAGEPPLKLAAVDAFAAEAAALPLTRCRAARRRRSGRAALRDLRPSACSGRWLEFRFHTTVRWTARTLPARWLRAICARLPRVLGSWPAAISLSATHPPACDRVGVLRRMRQCGRCVLGQYPGDLLTPQVLTFGDSRRCAVNAGAGCFVVAADRVGRTPASCSTRTTRISGQPYGSEWPDSIRRRVSAPAASRR